MNYAARIRFPCKWLDEEGLPNQGLSEFRLGEGPCGKEVAMLTFGRFDGGFYIKQHTSCDEVKEFFYKWEDVTGRVEVTHAGN